MAASMIAGVLPQWRMPAQRSRLTADIAAVRPDDAAVLVMLARAFHAEEARTLDAAGEAALVAIAQGEKLARAWLVRDGDRPAMFHLTYSCVPAASNANAKPHGSRMRKRLR
jgi:hypothetical protein